MSLIEPKPGSQEDKPIPPGGYEPVQGEIQKKAGKWGNGHIFKNMVNNNLLQTLLRQEAILKKTTSTFRFTCNRKHLRSPWVVCSSDQGFLGGRPFPGVLPAGMKLVVKEHPLQFSTSDKNELPKCKVLCQPEKKWIT